MLFKPEHSFQEESIIIKIGLQHHKVHKEGKLCISLWNFLLFLKPNVLDSFYLLALFFFVCW